MPGSAWFALTVAVNALAFAAGFRLGRNGRRAGTAVLLVAAPALVLKSVLNWRPDWEFALFPFSDYLYVQSWLGFPIGLFAMGLGVGLLKRMRDRRALALWAVLLFCISLWSERWMLMPAGHASDLSADECHHCVQSTQWSCAAAACVTLLSYLGVEATEGEMIRLCRSQPRGGTSLFRICRGLQLKLGDEAQDIRIVDGDPETLLGLGRPAIVTHGLMHVVTVKLTPTVVTVHDSLLPAPRILSLEQYRERYSGFAVVVEPR